MLARRLGELPQDIPKEKVNPQARKRKAPDDSAGASAHDTVAAEAFKLDCVLNGVCSPATVQHTIKCWTALDRMFGVLDKMNVTDADRDIYREASQVCNYLIKGLACI